MRTRNPKVLAKRLVERLRTDRKLRWYLILSLSFDAVCYTSVYLLVSHGVLDTWWANTAVSKGAAPVSLILNTLALTGRMWPTRHQTAKWLAYWIPSAFAGMICLGIVIAHFGLDSIQARAVVGVMLFPFDYLAKRFVVFANQQIIVLVFGMVLLWRRACLVASGLKFRMAAIA